MSLRQTKPNIGSLMAPAVVGALAASARLFKTKTEAGKKPAGMGAGRYVDPSPIRPGVGKIGRNERCPCGSGLKYKRCCDGKY